MGQFLEPGQMTNSPQTMGYENNPWFQNIMNQSPDQAPQTELPNTEISQWSANQSRQGVGNIAPQLNDFFSMMLQNGGAPGTSQLMDRMGQVRQNQMDELRGTLDAKYGRMSGNAANQVTKAMGGLNDQYALQQQQTMLDQNNLANQLKFAGAQGMQSIPGMYSTPSSIELSMINALSPYSMANLNSQNQLLGLQGGLQGQQLANNVYMPEVMMTPSPFDQYVAPFLGPLLQGFGQAAPTTVTGGGT